MDYLPFFFFFVLHWLTPVNACERVNFTIYPLPVYVGDILTLMCSTKDKAELTVSDFGNNSAICDQKQQLHPRGFYDKRSVNCSVNNGTHLLAFTNATTDMGGKNYTCIAVIDVPKASFTDSCNRTIYVLDVPELSLTPKDMTFNDNHVVTIHCSTNGTVLDANVMLTVTLTNNTTLLKKNTSLNSVEITFDVSRKFHEVAVRCETLQVSRIKAKSATLRVNYIFSKQSIVSYHSINRSHTFNCAEHVESRPGVQYKWFSAYSVQAIEEQSSYTCKAPNWCNTTVTCVATNNVTRAQSNVTFVYQNRPVELHRNDNSLVEAETVVEQGHYHMIIAMSVAGTVGTLVIVSVVIVVVCKWRSRGRKCSQHSKILCCGNEDEVIGMQSNDMYEAMPMIAAAAVSGGADISAKRDFMDPTLLGYRESTGQATSCIFANPHGVQSQHAIESLVVASVTVTANLKHKVGRKAHLVLLSERTSTLKDIQEKIEETVSAWNSLKHVAFLLRQAKNGLVLSLADNVNIDVNSVASNQSLRDFLKQLVGRYMDMSSDKPRLDLLNCPDTATSKEKKLAKTLTCLLGIPVYLSHDMYGVNTAIDDTRCVADVYFHRRHIENPVVYADVDLSKDSRQFPADSQEKVVYSEVVRPALRPPHSAGH